MNINVPRIRCLEILSNQAPPRLPPPVFEPIPAARISEAARAAVQTIQSKIEKEPRQAMQRIQHDMEQKHRLKHQILHKITIWIYLVVFGDTPENRKVFQHEDMIFDNFLHMFQCREMKDIICV